MKTHKLKGIKTVGYLPTNKDGKVLSNKVYKSKSSAKGQATRLTNLKTKDNE